MDGMEMLMRLTHNQYIERHSVVFILLGIDTTPADLKIYIDLGVQEYTSKPPDEETVMSAYHKYRGGNTAEQHPK